MTTSKNNLPSVFAANIFLLAILIITVIGAYLFKFIHLNSFYFSTLILEYCLTLLPVLLYLVFKGYDLKYVLKLNKLSYKQIIIIPLISICIAFIGIFLNTIMLFILSLFGDFTRVSQNIPIASSSSNFIILLLVTALTPAICEEALFRGLMLSCYEQLGIKKAIIASGIFFGIFHFSVNIQGLLGLSFMGIIFAYIVFKTNSLFASILAHLFYNSFGDIMKYITNFSVDTTIQIISPEIIIPNLIASAIFALPAGILCFILLKLLPASKSTDTRVHIKNRNHIKSNIIKSAPLLPIFLLYIYLCLKTLK